ARRETPDRARLYILDASGATLRSLPASSAAGLNRVYWPFQGKPAPRAALSPAQRRDSLMLVARINKAIDSLVAAGSNRASLDSLKTTLLTGGGFGGGGGG